MEYSYVVVAKEIYLRYASDHYQAVKFLGNFSDLEKAEDLIYQHDEDQHEKNERINCRWDYYEYFVYKCKLDEPYDNNMDIAFEYTSKYHPEE